MMFLLQTHDITQNTITVGQAIPWLGVVASVSFNAWIAKLASDNKLAQEKQATELRKEMADAQKEMMATLTTQRIEITRQVTEVSATFTLKIEEFRREFVPREGDVDRRLLFEKRLEKCEAEILINRERNHDTREDMAKIVLEISKQITDIVVGPLQAVNNGLTEMNRRFGEATARGRSQDEQILELDHRVTDLERVQT